jgi:hypothetical protein
MDRILEARDNYDNFKFYCDNFLSCVVGKVLYHRKKMEVNIRKIASASDEAFVIVCLENNIDRWQAEALDPEVDKKDLPERKYTNAPSECSKFSGWSDEGIKRYNELAGTIIPKKRKETKELEENFMLTEREEKYLSTKKSTKKQSRADEPATYAFLDLTEETDSEDETNHELNEHDPENEKQQWATTRKSSGSQEEDSDSEEFDIYEKVTTDEVTDDW